MIPSWLLTDPRVPDRVIRLYAILLQIGQAAKPDWPSRRQLAAQCGVSVASIDRAVKTAVELGAIEVEHRHKADGSPDVSRYKLNLNPPDGCDVDTPDTGGSDG